MCFEYAHQCLDRGTDIADHTLSVDLPMDVCTDRKPLTEVLDQNRERIIASLVPCQYLRAVIYLSLFLYRDGLAVPVVQHRTEQRCSAVDGAATLRLCERGVFVLQQLRQLLLRVL